MFRKPKGIGNVSPEPAAISLPLRKQGKDEAQRSIRPFYEAAKVRCRL